MAQKNDKRTKIFISYSQTDRKYLQELQNHLSYYHRLGDIDFWDDAKIKPGMRWYIEIVQAIQEAKIIIILVSADYLASSFIAKNELPPILEAAKNNKTVVLPILLGACFFMETPLAMYQLINSPSKPLNTMSRPAREKIWENVAQFIEDNFFVDAPFNVDESNTSIPYISPSSPLFNKPTLKTTLYTYSGHSERVNAVRWSPNGRYIASASDDLTVHVWDASTGSDICIFREHSNFVLSLSWSPDSRFIVSGSTDKTIRICDIQLGKEISTNTYKKAIAALTWSPDGQYIAAATADFWPDKSDNDFIYLVATTTGGGFKTYQVESKSYATLAWSPDGQYLASASADGNVEIVRSIDFLLDRTLATSASQVNVVGWSSNGRFIASGGDDNAVQIWDFSTSKVVKTYHGHSDPILALVWSPNERYIASAGEGKTVQVWDVTTGNLIQTYYRHSSAVLTLAWSPDGQRIASAGQDKTVQIWQIDFPTTQESSEYFLQEGNIYFEGQRYIDALVMYERALKLDTNSTFAHFNKGRSLYSLTRYEDALVSIGRAIKLLPNEISFYISKSDVLSALKRNQEALEVLNQALDLARKQGNLHIEQNGLYIIGGINRNMKRFQEAENNFKAALSISLKLRDVQGEGQALLALGLLAYQQRSLKNAKDFVERAQNIFEQLSDSQNSLKSLIALGQIYKDLKLLKQAKNYYEQALTLADQFEDTDSQEHILLCLGEFAVSAQYLEEAKYYYQRALAIADQSEDLEKQRNILLSLEKFALSTQNLDDAESLYKLALTVFERLPFSTAIILNNLAEIYQVQRRYAEAEPLYKRALIIREELLGTSHLDTAQSLNNLAKLYQAQGKYSEAEPLYERALAITAQELGTTHPDTASILDNLAKLYQVQGKYSEAEPLYEQTLAINKQVIGTIVTEFDQKGQVVGGYQQNTGRDINTIFPKSAWESLKVKEIPKIKVLFLAANPRNTHRLAIDKEMRTIEQKMRASSYLEALVFQSAWTVRPDDLLQLLNQHRPQIVHFSGHGDHAGLSLLGNDGQDRLVTTRALIALFETLKDDIRLVFLNTGYSHEQAQALATSIDCVIGLNEGAQDNISTVFASSFYRAISFGRSIQAAFDQGITSLLIEGITDEAIPKLLVKAGVDANQVVLIEPRTNP